MTSCHLGSHIKNFLEDVTAQVKTHGSTFSMCAGFEADNGLKVVNFDFHIHILPKSVIGITLSRNLKW